MYYLIVIFIYLLDQLSKFYIEKIVLQGASIPVVRSFFHITLVYNTGAAFGMFRRHPRLFIVIAVLAVALAVYFLARKFRILSTVERTALCFIIGGTLGNLTDRMRFGYVIDFIDLRVWPVFNFADSFITIGAVILGISVLAGFKRQRKQAESRRG